MRSEWTIQEPIVELSGCGGIGAPVIVRDRFDFNVAIAESWKSQMLLNIVKIRYADTPVFMDVTSVINLAGVQNTVNVGAGWSFPPAANSQSIGGSTTWGEKPTITYVPISGDKFTKSLLTPIPPSSLVVMMQAGWPARFLFTLCVKSVNELDNRTLAPAFARNEDPDYGRLVDLLEKIQKSGAVGSRIEKKEKQESVVLFFRRKANRNIDPEMSEAGRLLGLSPGGGSNLCHIAGDRGRKGAETAFHPDSLQQGTTARKLCGRPVSQPLVLDR